MYKSKKRRHRGKYVILISTIIALNAMGMTYAYWDDQLVIQTKLTTGYIKPTFCDENHWVNIVRDGSEKGNNPSWEDKNTSESELSKLDISFDSERQTMIINGTLEEGYKAFVHYCVYNDGTLPIKYKKNENEEGQNVKAKMSEGIKVQVEQQSKVLEPQEKLFSDDSNGNPKLQIQVRNQLESNLNTSRTSNEAEQPKFEEVGTYTFEINLPFKQWTGDNSSWGYEDEN